MLNKKFRKVLYSIGFGISSILLINAYKVNFDSYTIDLNEIDFTLIERPQPINNDPFELIKDFDFDNYLINRIGTALYNPPITNKLYPKSNLYGHELIRYFDF
jgi:hypothetical protein